MKGLRKLLLVIFVFIVILFTAFFALTIYNNVPFLENSPSHSVETIENIKRHSPSKTLKVLSYNIHFAMGLNGVRTDKVDKRGFKTRLDEIAKVLNDANADIVFLQEVDIDSSRSYRINQGKYLAEKAGYNYYAYASHWRRKIFPDINGRHGFLNHGLCILSRFPLSNHAAQVFELSKNIPFFLKWLFNPHGVQKVDVTIGGEVITLINLHLEPWSYQEREKQIKKVINWTRPLKNRTIIAGDLNVEPIETPFKSIFHLKDRPWFVKIDQEKLQDEQTLVFIQQKGFVSSINPKLYLKNPKKYYSYPSINPQVQLDYIFVSNKLEIINGYIFHKANYASDHLPVLAKLKLSSQYTANCTKGN